MPFYSRKPTRLPEYDYATQNYYFVTICTHNKECIFGTVEKRNAMGKIAEEGIENIQNIYHGVRVDVYSVMPNHVHIILVLEQVDEKQKLPNISMIVGQYKAFVTKKIRKNHPRQIVWQRSFYDHIIRNQQSYENIWNYVKYNGQKWKEDCYYQETN